MNTENLDTHKARIDAKKTELDKELESYHKAANERGDREHPTNVKLTERRLHIERHARAKVELDKAEARIIELRNEIKAVVGTSETGNGSYNLLVNARFPHLKNAPFFADVIREYLKESDATLIRLTDEVRQLAKVGKCEYLLPEDLK